jgi:predicted ATP-grasp superfamily ATP-dependent carboligase
MRMRVGFSERPNDSLKVAKCRLSLRGDIAVASMDKLRVKRHCNKAVVRDLAERGQVVERPNPRDQTIAACETAKPEAERSSRQLAKEIAGK